MLEEVIISCFLIDKSSQDYLDKVEIEDFLNPNNQEIIKIMKELRNENVGIDYVTVANKMPFSELSIKTLPMADVRFEISNIEQYIKQLKMQSATRKINKVLTKARYDIVDGKKIDEVIKDTTDNINNIDFLDEDKLVDVGKIDPSKYIDRVKVKSEFSNLDKMIGGFSMGELSIWSGKSGQRKIHFFISTYA